MEIFLKDRHRSILKKKYETQPRHIEEINLYLKKQNLPWKNNPGSDVFIPNEFYQMFKEYIK